MSVSVIIEGSTADDIVVHVDPLSELGALVHAVLHGSHHPRSRISRERIIESDTGQLMLRAQRFRPFFGVVRARFLLPTSMRTDACPSFEARLSDVAGLPLEDFARFAAVSLVEDSRTFRGELYPLRETQLFLHELERLSPTRLELGHMLIEDPETVRRQLLDLLIDLEATWFRREWDEIRGVLSQEAELRRREIARIGPTAIADISPTAIVTQDPERVVFDKINRARLDIRPLGLILAPSHHISPHLVVKYDGTFPNMITYAVGDAEHSVSLAIVKLRLLALQDDARMEICRCIARIPMTTVDLAIELQMTQPQVSRHLRTLREAQLVTREQRGRFVYYSLNASVLRSLGAQIIATMLR